MKKFSIAMLSMVLAGSMLLTGCGGSKTADSSSDAQDSTTSTSADGGSEKAQGHYRPFPAVRVRWRRRQRTGHRCGHRCCYR